MRLVEMDSQRGAWIFVPLGLLERQRNVDLMDHLLLGCCGFVSHCGTNTWLESGEISLSQLVATKKILPVECSTAARKRARVLRFLVAQLMSPINQTLLVSRS